MVGRGEGRERKMKLGYWGGGGAIERGLCSAFLSIKCPVWNGGRRGDCGVCPAQVGFRRVPQALWVQLDAGTTFSPV